MGVHGGVHGTILDVPDNLDKVDLICRHKRHYLRLPLDSQLDKVIYVDINDIIYGPSPGPGPGGCRGRAGPGPQPHGPGPGPGP